MTEAIPVQDRVSVAGFKPGTPGVTPPSDPERRGVFLADVIVELGLAEREAVDSAERVARDSGRPIERALLDSGTLDERQLAMAIAERSGLDLVDLDQFEVDMRAAEMIGRSVAQRYSTVPIAFAADGALIVATQDAFDSLGVSDIEVMTGSEVRRTIATRGGIQAVIERLPEEAPKSAAHSGSEPLQLVNRQEPPERASV